jgi:hypothetical protein
MMLSIRRSGVVLGAVLVTMLAVGPGDAFAQAKGDKATELKAREAFAAGRFDEALSLFAKLYAESLHPVYLRNIGRCHQKMRQPQKAIDAFKDYLAKAKKIPADDRKEVEGFIKEMETLRDEQAKAATPTPPPPPVVTPTPTPTPTPPPEPPVLMPMGSDPNAAGRAPTLVGQATPPAEAESPVYKKWWFWTLIGAAVAGGVVAAVVLSSGGVERPNCTPPIICM